MNSVRKCRCSAMRCGRCAAAREKVRGPVMISDRVRVEDRNPKAVVLAMGKVVRVEVISTPVVVPRLGDYHLGEVKIAKVARVRKGHPVVNGEKANRVDRKVTASQNLPRKWSSKSRKQKPGIF